MAALLVPASVQAQNKTVPNIVGRNLDGNLASLRREINGQKALINFWWVKCSPCKAELPDLIAKEKKHPNTKFIYVHAETNPKTKSAYEASEVKEFLNSLGLKLTNVIVGNTKARLSAGVEALPTTVLVNSSGQIDAFLIGYTPENTESIAKWLNK